MPAQVVPPARVSTPAQPVPPAQGGGNVKDAILAEIRKGKVVFYQTVVAQAQRIEVTGDRVTFTFSPTQKTLREMFEQNRAWLESIALQATGRKFTVAAAQADAAAPAVPAAAGELSATSESQKKADKKTALREQALADAGVQTMLEVFPAEIRDVEEM
jgi:hypothetical protein